MCKKLTLEGHKIINNHFKSLFEKIKDDNEIKDEKRINEVLDLINSLNEVSLDPEVDSRQIDWKSFADVVKSYLSCSLSDKIKKNFPDFFKIINERIGGNTAGNLAILGDLGF